MKQPSAKARAYNRTSIHVRDEPTPRALPQISPWQLRWQPRQLQVHVRARVEKKSEQHQLLSKTAHRGANGAAMPTDEDDHDDNFLFNHPERGGGLCCRLGAHSRCYHYLDPIPPTEGGHEKR